MLYLVRRSRRSRVRVVRASARMRYVAATKRSKVSREATDGAAGHLIRTKAGKSTGWCSSTFELIGLLELAGGQNSRLGHVSPRGAIKVPGSARDANLDRLTRRPGNWVPRLDCHESDPAVSLPPPQLASNGWDCAINPDGLPDGDHPGGSTATANP